MPQETQSAEQFLSSRQTRARYGDVSDMWLDRRLNDASGFPSPIYIRRRRFWRLSDLVDWEDKIASRGQTEVAA